MKAVVAGALVALAGAAGAQTITINGSGSAAGNGNSGFGGVIGTGSMDIVTLADGTVNITLNRGASEHFNATVIYIDSLAGGVTNTSVLTDTADGGRAGISGQGFGGETSDLGFASGFGADFAISYETAFGGLFSIGADPTNHGFVAAVGGDFGGQPGTSSADASFLISFNMADIGLAAGDSFSMVATYLNNGNAFRSGEFIGSTATGPFPNDPNIGQAAFDLGDDDYILVNSVPAPGTAALLGLGGLAAVRRRR
ncbi:MAG: PEP-CTERM sorting domain-containing protein [Phycisphaerales bacterium]